MLYNIRNQLAKKSAFFLAIAYLLCFPATSKAELPLDHSLLAPLRASTFTNSNTNFGQTIVGQNPSVLPTDVTPFQVIRPRYAMGSDFKFRLYKKLPAPFWFTAVTEETGRWETNVYQAPNHGVQDFVFRSLPNITAGWAIGKNTNIYTNYFVIKDIYAAHGNLSFPTTMSLSIGARHDFPISEKTVIQFDAQARELWETVHLHQADLLPAINLTRIINPHIIFFSSLLLQMRSRELFQGPTREIDPFYNAGFAMSYNNWNFVITDTYVTNFRNSTAVPPQGNVSMIADFEVSHPVSKRIPGVLTFIRAEPIWNWRSHFIVGQSGYDFRLYGGLRFTMTKPAYNADIEELRARLRRQARAMQELEKSKNNSQPNN